MRSRPISRISIRSIRIYRSSRRSAAIFSVTAGYIHVAGNRIPVVRITNLPPIIGTLADGRRVFGSGARPNPNFNNINITESVGKSSYHAGSLSLNKRFSKGYQLSASSTWSTASMTRRRSTSIDSTEFPSDPTNRRRDRGNSLADQRHTFILSGVLNPKFDVSNRIAARSRIITRSASSRASTPASASMCVATTT